MIDIILYILSRDKVGHVTPLRNSSLIKLRTYAAGMGMEIDDKLVDGKAFPHLKKCIETIIGGKHHYKSTIAWHGIASVAKVVWGDEKVVEIISAYTFLVTWGLSTRQAQIRVIELRQFWEAHTEGREVEIIGDGTVNGPLYHSGEIVKSDNSWWEISHQTPDDTYAILLSPVGICLPDQLTSVMNQNLWR